MEEKPKFEIGQRIYAHWNGGDVTSHVIKGIKTTPHGYWYEWDEEGHNNGLHENYLSAGN